VQGKKQRVLVVDDDEGMLRAAQRVLSPQYEVLVAGSASKALETAASHRPDLAVCDIRMPEMDGYALVAALRAGQPDMDAIFMTGSQTEPDGHLVRSLQHDAFYFIQKPFDRRVLSTLVSRCLELRALRQTQRAHLQHLKEELEEARLFQRTMLAPESAELSGARLEARCFPCQELGGDLYDYALAPDGRVAFILADVRGHGASAALLTAVVKAVFHTSPGFEPGLVAGRLAAAVGPFGDDRFVTAFCGLLDPKTGQLEYVNAGHPAAVVRGAKGCIEIKPNAPLACAAFPKDSWHTARAEIGRGALLVAYTDGLAEALDPSRAGRGAALVRELVERGPSDAAGMVAAVAEAVTQALHGRPAVDDISVLVIGT
jgi:sigma-B regulation protein RsbU (phosphoserine phosphatase)